MNRVTTLLALSCVAAALPAFANGVQGAGALKAEPVSTKVETKLERITSSTGELYTVARYGLPVSGSVPHIIAVDQEDYVWFTESGGRFAQNFIDAPAANRIGRIDHNGLVTEWTIAEDETSPMGVHFDQQGTLWITERLADRITRFDADGSLTHYPVPTKGSWPTGIAIGPDGKVWITETMGNKVAVLDPQTEKVTEYEIPTPDSKATGIAVDKNGVVWIAQRDANIIGRLDPKTEEFSQFAVPTPRAKPCGIIALPNGEVWFSERDGGKLARIYDDGTIKEYALADRSTGPFLMVPDNYGSIWFSEIFASRIGRFDVADQSFEYFKVSEDTKYPAGIGVDSKGNVWFAEQASDHLGVIVRTDLAYMAPEGERQSAAPKDNRIQVISDFDFTEYAVPTPNSIPGIVEIDSQGTVWFTQMGGGFVGPGFPPGPPGSNVGYVEGNKVHELALPTPESGPTSLAIDRANDVVWVSLRSANKLARIENKKIVEIDIPLDNAEPVGVSVDAQHNVWVALAKAAKIGTYTHATGAWSFYDLPDPASNPRTIYVDRLQRIWFAEKDGNHLGRIHPESGLVKRWKIPTRMAWPLSIVDDVSGDIWFAQMRSDKLGVFTPSTESFREYSLPLQSAPFKVHYDEENASIWVSTVFANAVLHFDMNSERVVAAYPIRNEGVWMGGIARDAQGCFWVTEQFGNQLDRMCLDPQVVSNSP